MWLKRSLGLGRGHFFGAQPLLFWQLSRQLAAKRINRREEKAVVLIFQMSGNNFGWHTHGHYGISLWKNGMFITQYELGLALTIWKLRFEMRKYLCFSTRASTSHQKRFMMWAFSYKHSSRRRLSKSGRLEVCAEFILSPQSGRHFSLCLLFSTCRNGRGFRRELIRNKFPPCFTLEFASTVSFEKAASNFPLTRDPTLSENS